MAASVRQQNDVARHEELRRTRLDSFAALCEAIVEYRWAQLHRWFVGQDVGSPEDVERTRPEVAEEVRRTRASAWGQFYKVVMICDDGDLEARARHAMALTKQMKFAENADALNELSDQVHDAVDDFARRAGMTVRTPRQATV